MRMSIDRIVELYKTSPVFQDLLETAAGTGVAAGGQALFTDMSPEEIALSSAAGFGAGMIGRPIIGKVGEEIGGVLDRRVPQFGENLQRMSSEFTEMMPEALREMSKAKSAPYKHLGGASQYFNMFGRSYGDNIAQAGVALAAPGIFGGNEEVE